RLVVSSGSPRSASRRSAEPTGVRSLRLLSGSSPWSLRCRRTRPVSRAWQSASSWPWSSRIRSRGLDLSATQVPKAATRASRLRKLFWSASRPNRRLPAVLPDGEGARSSLIRNHLGGRLLPRDELVEVEQGLRDRDPGSRVRQFD